MSTDYGLTGLDTFLVIMNIITLIIGIIGNISASTVIVCTRSMYTITNFYLLSLSVSDVLILISGPVQYINFYFNPESIYDYDKKIIWPLISTWIFETSVNASILTITAFTVERYLAICFPFVARSLSTISRVIKIIITVWLVAALLALIPTVQDFIQARGTSNNVKEINSKFRLYSTDILAVLYFFIPMTLITVLYILIGIKLRARSKMRQVSTQSDNNTEKTLKMFVLIVLTFILCWAPFYLSKVLWLYMVVASENNWDPYNSPLWYFSIIKLALYPLSPASNPIIYTVMSKKFREAYKNLLLKNHSRRPRFTYTKNNKTTLETAL